MTLLFNFMMGGDTLPYNLRWGFLLLSTSPSTYRNHMVFDFWPAQELDQDIA